jgi:hypothetical protein
MSLSGVRDLSMIGTPPVDRLAIRTYVSEFDAVTIREALLREHYRGGQSFYVVPRIEDLPGIEAFLREQVPEVSFVTAHGQMAAGDLDDRMNAFYDGNTTCCWLRPSWRAASTFPPPTPWSSTAPTCSAWRSFTRSGAGWGAPRPAPMPT